MRLPAGLRRAFMALGPVLIVVGFGLFVSSGFGMVSSPPSPGEGFDVPVGSILGGMALFMLGGILTRLGWLKAGSELVATETAGAVEHVAGAAGRGWASQVRIKCRDCGFLETEQAKFCSDCGQAL